MDEEKISPYFRYMDTLWQAWLARFTLGISPAGARGAFHAWISHLFQAPGKVTEIALYPTLNACRFAHRMTCERSEERTADPRFKSKNWNIAPWRFYAESFMFMEDWARKATTDIPGLEDHEERTVSFTTRQVMDSLCPANFPATNPDLFYRTLSTGGHNLVSGMRNAWEDVQDLLLGGGAHQDRKFEIGKNLAVTKGDVVFRNDLMELI